jgi:flagellar hook assembly protein FlgD
VYDVSGRLVTVLADGAAEAGNHAARWDGRDAQGRPVSSGVYFCRLTVDGWTDAEKMTLLK